MAKPLNPPDVIFDPKEVGRRTILSVERIADHKDLGLRTGIPMVDEVLKPMMPNRLTGILGYTSNGKSTLANTIARHNAYEIAKSGDPNRCVVTFTWEQTVEEQGLDDIAHISQLPISVLYTGSLNTEQWDIFREGAEKRASLPWWIIGHSSEDLKRRPRMNMTNVAQVMDYLADELGLTPTLIVLDYLQRIGREKELMRESFIEVVDRAKDMTHAFHCHTILVSQAKREVTERKWQLPGIEDSQETSNFEQTCDAILSTWLPKNTFQEGEQLTVEGTKYPVDDNLMLVNIVKQKKGKCPYVIPMHVNWDNYSISKIVMKNLNDIANFPKRKR